MPTNIQIPFIVIFLFVCREKDGPYAISEVKSVTRLVVANSERGDTVLSAWPAYPVLSKREPSAGMETWGWELIPFLSSEQNQRFRLVDNLSIRREIADRRPHLIVVGIWFLPQFEDLIRTNYRLLGTTRFAKVYVRGGQ